MTFIRLNGNHGVAAKIGILASFHLVVIWHSVHKASSWLSRPTADVSQSLDIDLADLAACAFL
jgi:hypothetical protein